jgi:hypothetical protein
LKNCTILLHQAELTQAAITGTIKPSMQICFRHILCQGAEATKDRAMRTAYIFLENKELSRWVTHEIELINISI